MPRYEFQEGTSSKFWEIMLSGKSFTTRFGKIGSTGQTKLKEHASEAAAKAEYEKLIAEKTRKGYALVGGNGKSAKPAKAAAPAGQYFEYKDGSSRKFWEIVLDGKSHTVRFGKIGTAGQTSKKTFKSPGEARADHDKLVAEKTKKGYKLLRGQAPAAPAATHARNDKLEAAIAADPDNPDAYLVYADWLQGQGDPRGELIVLQHANKTAAANKLIEQNNEHFFGKLADAQDVLAPSNYNYTDHETRWRWGYLETLRINGTHERDPEFGDGESAPVDIVKALGWMLDHPSCRFLRELAVGIVTFEDNSYDGIAKVIGARRLPTLRKLFLGDFCSEETELNWSALGKLEPMYRALPNLEVLVLRSGSMKVGKIDLPKLRELRVISGGFDPGSLAAICNAKWPHLETLNLQLGGEHRFTPKHLQPIFDGKAFPKVVHLGLGNSEVADTVCQGLASSKIAARLVSLDLSDGTMSDVGAAALAAGAFPRLQTLDVSQNYLTKKGLAMLKSVAKTVISKAGHRGQAQRSDDGNPQNRYIAAYE